MSSLAGRNVLVTGSTQGVGQAIVIAAAKAGANVVIHGLHADDSAKETRRTCLETGVDAQLVTGDLTDSQGVQDILMLLFGPIQRSTRWSIMLELILMFRL